MQHRFTEAFLGSSSSEPLLGALSRLGDKSGRMPSVYQVLPGAIPPYSRWPFYPVWPVVMLDVSMSWGVLRARNHFKWVLYQWSHGGTVQKLLLEPHSSPPPFTPR